MRVRSNLQIGALCQTREKSSPTKIEIGKGRNLVFLISRREANWENTIGGSISRNRRSRAIHHSNPKRRERVLFLNLYRRSSRRCRRRRNAKGSTRDISRTSPSERSNEERNRVLSATILTSDSHAPITPRGGRGKEYLLASFIEARSCVNGGGGFFHGDNAVQEGRNNRYCETRACPEHARNVHAIPYTCFMAFDANLRSFHGPRYPRYALYRDAVRFRFEFTIRQRVVPDNRTRGLF